MKGIIFSEFLEMMELNHGYATVNAVVDASKLSTQGIYSSSGNYPHEELIQLVNTLAEQTQIPAEEILLKFGNYLFGRFTTDHQEWLQNINHPFDLFQLLDSHIHQEVRKIYPEAKTPTFRVLNITANKLEMEYQSNRRLDYFALGLIEATMQYFGYQADIQLEPTGPETVLFTIKII